MQFSPNLYWSSEKNEVVTRYLDSAFLGHTTADDLLEGITSSLDDLNMNNIIQVSMDGSLVNWKLLSSLKATISADNPDAKMMFELGSCGLHVLQSFEDIISEK